MKRMLMNRSASLRNQNGMSLLAATLSLAFVSVMGLAVVQASTADIEETANHAASSRAFYASTAGLEWAKFKLSRDEDPNVTDLAFDAADPDRGRFTVAYDTTAHVITSTGNANDAKSVQTMTTVTQAECVESTGTPDANFSCPLDYTYTWSYGGLYSVDVQRSSRAECAGMEIRVSAINIDNLKGSQKLMQIFYESNTIDSAQPDSDGQIYSRDGFNYFSTATGYVEDSDEGISPIDYETANFTDITINDASTHRFNELYIVYDKYNMAATTVCPDMPVRGDQFSLNFVFSDGSSYNKVITY
jgi:Tfp pilus assembly protein PilV